MSQGWAPQLGTAEGTPAPNPTELSGVHPTGCGEQNKPRGPGRGSQAVGGEMSLESLLKALGVFQGWAPNSPDGLQVARALRRIRSEQSCPSQPSM